MLITAYEVTHRIIHTIRAGLSRPQLTMIVSASGRERGEYEKVTNFSLNDEQGGMGETTNFSTSSENT